MKEKSKARKPSVLKISVPLWIVSAIIIVSISLISILSNENSKLEKALANPFVITATPTYYGSSDSQVTFIEASGSPTPDVESTAEVEVSTQTIMCHEIERSDNGQFVIRMFLQSGMELFRIDEDGTNFCRLTNNTGNDDYPVWSPDGTKIAYISNEGVYGLYQMDAHGDNIELLHTGGTAYSYPAWSPDGHYLVFQATFDEIFDIYQLALATGELTNLTNQERLDNMPSYSSDGQYIVFVSDRTFNPFIDTNFASQFNNYEIYMMDNDGRNPRRITVNNQADGYPSFSPDGTQIVYGMWNIRIMNRDGSESHALVNGSEPHWLSDGRIAYIGTKGIHTILPDGSEEQIITDEIPLFGSGIRQIDFTPPR